MESMQMSRRAVGFDDNDRYIDTTGVENDDDPEEEETPLNQTANNKNKELSWDAARIVPPPASEESETPKWVENGVRCMKIGAYLITFLAVLASAAIASGTFLFMTSQIKIDRTVSYCNRNYGSDKNLEVKATETSRISWIWIIFFSFSTPQVFIAGRSLRMVFFKTIPRPEFWPTFTVVFIFETLHVIGLALMAFVVLPSLDSIKAAMLTSCVCFVPGILGLMSRNLFGKEDKKCTRGMSLSLKIILDMAAIGGQATCIIAWPFVMEPELGSWKIWLIPASVILTSCGWWENYVDYHSPVPFIKWFGEIKNDLLECRYWTYAYISIWKMALFFVAMVVYVKFVNEENITVLFDSARFSESFGDYLINITEVSNFEIGSLPGTSIDNFGQAVEPLVRRADAQVALQVFYIHVAAGWACYIFSKFACKVTITEFSFAFPLNMAMPVVVCTIILFCALRGDDACYFRGSIPDYMFYTCPSGDFLEDFIFKEHGWVWLVWLLSQMWITVHTWAPMPERLLPTERIFCTPMYESLLMPLSMMLNKRRDDGKHLPIKKKKKKGAENNADAEEQPEEEPYEEKTMGANMYFTGDGADTAMIKQAPHGKYPKIIACATMWHESRDEMIACLKSIFRIDFDQSSRRLALNYLDIDDDYYDYETHIFFDDAFVLTEDRLNYVVNSFVKDLIEVMPEAATLVHGTETNLSPPKKYATPYGGRLVWTLPGKTKVICHVKDKNKIRHRKRWSQCMYMYYLLGYNIMQRTDLSLAEKDAIVANTYLLALDGDIDFQARAVLLLVDLMKRNPHLGAACGRIHPIGTDGAGGLMVWYQQFEYAVGHWFQKATEHVIGCVLCSPGCFSLFRGAALLDDNVMKRYTAKSSQARHYVQFDQGEDRWLCTLMLQQGWRVEYSAASDSFTHCPEGFEEFYNQRRRWVPSTMANILDLLQDYKRTVAVNDNISLPYIGYQMFLMVGTILGPGTIFMMMTGAFNAAFRIEIMDAFLINMVPLLAFMLVCYFMDSKYQLMFAQVLTALYAMVMMAVVVGTALQLQQEGVDSPSGIFFISMACSFIITGFLHPQELYCLPSGLVYYLTVPSMYLLLIIYSVFNLNNVSWGTREVAKILTLEEEEEARKELEQAAMKKAESKGLFKMFEKMTGADLSGMFSGGSGSSYDGFISCMCCAGAKPREQEATLLGISQSLKDLSRKLEGIEKNLEPSHRTGVGVRRNSSLRRSSGSISAPKGMPEKVPLLNTVVEEDQEDEEDDDGDGLDDLGSISSDPKSEDMKPQERDELTNPYWLEDPALRRCTVDFLNSQEILFWKELIEKYLYPLDEEKPDVKKKIQDDLLALRDKVIASFFMFNAIFILVVMLLQANKSSLHVDWPLNIKTNISFYAGGTGKVAEVVISEEYLELEPVGMVFVFCFFIVLVTQFIAMLFHRLTTVMHLIATCNLGEVFKFGGEESKSQDPTIDGGEADLKKNAVKVVKQLQSLRTVQDKEEENERRYSKFGRRNTVANLAKAQRKKPTAPADLDAQFRKRLFSITETDFQAGGPSSSAMLARRGTIKTLQGIMGSDASEDKARALGQALLKRRNTMHPSGPDGPARRPSSFASRGMIGGPLRTDSITAGGILRRAQSARIPPGQTDSARSSLASMPSTYQRRPTFSSSTRSSTSNTAGMEDIIEHDSSEL